MRLSFVYLLIVGSLNVPIKRFPLDYKKPYVTASFAGMRQEVIDQGLISKISNFKTSITFKVSANMNLVLSLK